MAGRSTVTVTMIPGAVALAHPQKARQPCRRPSGKCTCQTVKNVGGAMNRYVESTEQLVTEILVRDIRRSRDFYTRLGFELLRDAGDFVELTWEDHRLFLAELSAFQ